MTRAAAGGGDSSDEGEQAPHADYLGVHAGMYQRIAAGERAGWSAPAEAAGMLAQVQRALSLPAAPQCGRLLELGCGDGCLSVLLAAHLPFAASGIDIVPLAIDLARKRAARAGVTLELRCGDVLDLPWPDGSFDLLVDGHCLHCIVLDDRERFLAEAWRVLRPGGMLVLLCMVGEPPPDMPGSFDVVTRNVVLDGVIGRHFGTPESILAEARQAGFGCAAYWTWPAPDASANDDLVAVLVR